MWGYILDTKDLESFLGLGVDKVLAINLDRVNSGGSASKGKRGGQKLTVGLYENSISIHEMVVFTRPLACARCKWRIPYVPQSL